MQGTVSLCIGRVSEIQRAAVVVRGTPDTVSGAKLAWDLARDYGDEAVTAIAWEIVERLPDWMNVGLRDQLEAHFRDVEDGHYIIVWLGTEQEIEDLALYGDPYEIDASPEDHEPGGFTD